MSTTKIRSDYMVFLDNTRIDHMVTSFSTQHSKDGAMPSASVTMQVQFSRNLTNSEYNAEFGRYRDDIYKLRNSIKEKTNLFIYVKNVVSGKFNLVFNGLVSDIFVSTNKSKRIVSLDIRGVGSISVLNEIEAILAIPWESFANANYDPIAFKLMARTLDVKSAKWLTQVKVTDMQNMTIRTMLENTVAALNATNMTYRNSQGMLYFNDVVGKVKIYSDISPDLMSNGIIDSGFTTSALMIDTLYVTLARQLSKLMFEFYEMPDGEIVIKAPYWNTPILHNHIIPDIAIIDENMQNRWSNRVTRMLIQGDVSPNTDPTSSSARFSMPMAAYAEDEAGNGKWADLRSSGISQGVDDTSWRNEDTGEPKYTGSQTGVGYLDTTLGKLIEDDPSGGYLSYRTSSGATISHSSWAGIVHSIQTNEEIGTTPKFKGYQDHNVVIQIVEGPYKGYFVAYGGIVTPSVKIHERITSGKKIGKTYKWSSADESDDDYHALYADKGAANVFIKVLYPDYQTRISDSANIYINPKVFFRDYASGKKSVTTSGATHVNIGDFSTPTDVEMYYGVKFNEESQPIIKFAHAGFATTPNGQLASNVIRKYAAYRYKTINANVSTMSLSLMPMPWLKPGLNVWVDPTGINEVYYVSSVSHSGSPQGVFTNVYLTMGRPADSFFNASKETSFGSVGSGGTYGNNIFINNDVVSMEEGFNEAAYVKSYATKDGYYNIMDKTIKFKTNGSMVYNINQDPYMQELYIPKYQSTSAVNLSPNRVSELSGKREVSAVEAQTMLDNMFTGSSSYIKGRAAGIREFVANLKGAYRR